MKRPRVVYHGSTLRLARIVPHAATGIGRARDQLAGIYAAADPKLAIPFALPILADADGATLWTLEPNLGGAPRIVIERGHFDRDGVGFIYELDAAPFEPVDDWQWIANEPMEALAVREIRAADYVHWIAG